MRNTFGKLCVIIATVVLLFSAGFFTVSLVLRDSDLIGNLYKDPEIQQQVEASTGMNRTAELENAATVLLSYMRGERMNIKVGGNVNGVYRDDLFSIDKEVVHMAEVQTLWLGLEAFAKYGALGAAALLLIGFLLIERGKKRAILASGIFWGCGILGGVLVLLGIWALLDFDSFWTVFHFLIFPKTLFQYLSAGATVQAMNELNWVLPNNSIMVNMLFPIFPSLVIRCAVCVVLEIAVAVIAAVFIGYAFRKQGRPSPVADVVVIEHDENEPIPIKGPDLVLAHVLQNTPVSKREEVLRRAKNGEPPVEEKQSTPVAEHLVPPLYPKEETTPLSPAETSPLAQGRQETPAEADEEHAPASQPPSDEGGVSGEATEGETTPDGTNEPVGTGIARPSEQDAAEPEAEA